MTEELLLHAVIPPAWPPVNAAGAKMGLTCHPSGASSVSGALELPVNLRPPSCSTQSVPVVAIEPGSAVIQLDVSCSEAVSLGLVIVDLLDTSHLVLQLLRRQKLAHSTGLATSPLGHR